VRFVPVSIDQQHPVVRQAGGMERVSLEAHRLPWLESLAAIGRTCDTRLVFESSRPKERHKVAFRRLIDRRLIKGNMLVNGYGRRILPGEALIFRHEQMVGCLYVRFAAIGG